MQHLTAALAWALRWVPAQPPCTWESGSVPTEVEAYEQNREAAGAILAGARGVFPLNEWPPEPRELVLFVAVEPRPADVPVPMGGRGPLHAYRYDSNINIASNRIIGCLPHCPACAAGIPR